MGTFLKLSYFLNFFVRPLLHAKDDLKTWNLLNYVNFKIHYEWLTNCFLSWQTKGHHAPEKASAVKSRPSPVFTASVLSSVTGICRLVWQLMASHRVTTWPLIGQSCPRPRSNVPCSLSMLHWALTRPVISHNPAVTRRHEGPSYNHSAWRQTCEYESMVCENWNVLIIVLTLRD